MITPLKEGSNVRKNKRLSLKLILVCKFADDWLLET